jgi:hypothetical protein
MHPKSIEGEGRYSQMRNDLNNHTTCFQQQFQKKQDISHESVTTKISTINSAAIHSPLLSSDEAL